MFRCEQCGTQSKRGETPVKVVTETRSKVYHPSKHQLKSESTAGEEIVKEVTVCKTCAVDFQEVKE